MNQLSTALVALALVSAPSLAEACSVCIGGETQNRTEFIIATAFMTFLPMLMIGGVVYGLRRRIQRIERENAEFAADPSALHH